MSRTTSDTTAFNLSTSWGLVHYQDLARFARDAGSWGFAGIEANYSVSLNGLAELQTSSIPISSFHFPGPLALNAQGSPVYTGPLAPVTPDQKEVAREHAARVIREAAQSGAAAVVFHASDLPQLQALERRLAALCTESVRKDQAEAARQELLSARAAAAPPLLAEVEATLAHLLPLAEELGIRLGLETRADVRDIPSRQEMRQLLSRFPSPFLGYWNDTGHAYRQQLLGFGPALEWLEEFGDRLVGMHLSDCRGLDDHYPPGQGEIDFQSVLRFARPDTVLTVELNGRHSAEEVRAGLAYLTNVDKRIGSRTTP
jgi:sugar phosphate isomerase/epimerase